MVPLLVVAAVAPPRILVPPTVTAVTIELALPEYVMFAVWLPCIDTLGVYPAAEAGP